MPSNAYPLAKIGFDTAENEPAKNLQTFANETPPPPLVQQNCMASRRQADAAAAILRADAVLRPLVDHAIDRARLHVARLHVWTVCKQLLSFSQMRGPNQAIGMSNSRRCSLFSDCVFPPSVPFSPNSRSKPHPHQNEKERRIEAQSKIERYIVITLVRDS